MKKFKVDLFSVSSINQLAKNIETYRDDLPNKCARIVEKLKDLGITVAKTYIDASPLGSTITLHYEHTSEPYGSGVIIIATGTDFESTDGRVFNSLLGVEFGAGIHYNKGNANPKAKEHGMGVGTFPGQRFAFREGWRYKGADGEYHYSHGVKATMPMYEASKQLKRQVRAIIKEVFAYG